MSYVGLYKFYDSFLKFDLITISIVFFLVFLIVFLNAINLKLLGKKIIKVPFLNFFQIYLISWAFGFLFPSKLGEFSLVYFLNKKGISKGESSAVLVLDKIISLFASSFFGSFSLILFFNPQEYINIFIFLGFLWVVILFFVFSEKGRSFIKNYFLRSYKIHFSGFSVTLFQILKNKPVIIVNLIITIIRLLLQTLVIFILLLSLNFQADFLSLFFLFSASSLLSFVPFTFNGIGLREGVFILIAEKIAIPNDFLFSALAMSLIINFIFIFLILIIFIRKLDFR